jgi:hypothetical protein
MFCAHGPQLKEVNGNLVRGQLVQNRHYVPPGDDALEGVLLNARTLLDQEPEKALALYGRVIEQADGFLWSEAHTDLASYHYGHGEYDQAAEHARTVLDGPAQLDSDANRARAGVMLNNARDMNQQPIDEDLLRSSAEACIRAGHPYFGGVGLSILGRHRWLAGDRSAAREYVERAVDLFDQAGSVTAGPYVLKRLTGQAIEQQDPERARRYAERGIEHLRKFPLRGIGARRVEKQLEDLRKQVADMP